MRATSPFATNLDLNLLYDTANVGFMMGLHIPIYRTFYIFLTVITLGLILITPLSIISHLPRPTSSPEFVTPLILICAAYVLILAASLLLYSARLWKVKRQIDQIPRRVQNIRKVDLERRERAIARSALVAYAARPPEDDEVGGRDGVIKEVPEMLGQFFDDLGDFREGYERLRWGRGGGEGDEFLWNAVMTGVGRLDDRRKVWESEQEAQNLHNTGHSS